MFPMREIQNFLFFSFFSFLFMFLPFAVSMNDKTKAGYLMLDDADGHSVHRPKSKSRAAAQEQLRGVHRP